MCKVILDAFASKEQAEQFIEWLEENGEDIPFPNFNLCYDGLDESQSDEDQITVNLANY